MSVYQEITARVKEKVGEDCGLDATVKFVLDDEHIIFIDSTIIPNTISHDDQPADCTIKLKSKTIEKIISGESSAFNAFMMGKIKVEGNMSIALNINKIL